MRFPQQTGDPINAFHWISSVMLELSYGFVVSLLKTATSIDTYIDLAKDQAVKDFWRQQSHASRSTSVGTSVGTQPKEYRLARSYALYSVLCLFE